MLKRPKRETIATPALALACVLLYTGNCYGQDSAESTPELLKQPVEAAAAPASQPTLKKLEAHQLQLLAATTPNTEVVWLEVAGLQPVFAIYRAESSGNPRGAVLILHGDGQHPSWPGLIQQLVEHLPQSGLAVMSVALPNSARQVHTRGSSPRTYTAAGDGPDEPVADSAPIGSADENGRTNPELATGEESRQIEKSAQDIVTAAAHYLNNLNHHSLAVLGVGLGAQRALSYLASQPAVPFQAMLLTDLKQENLFEQTGLIGKVPESLPILDIVTDSDIESLLLAKQRLAEARRNGSKQYSQRKLHPQVFQDGSRKSQITKIIQGYLRHHMKGAELPNGQAAPQRLR